MTRPIIQVEHLIAKYDERVILDDISFEVSSGEIFFIVGGSGCGKTTLLNNMIGLIEPAGGDIWIDGDDMATATYFEQLAMLKKIGVMYQSGALFGSMDLLENVRLPLEEFTALPSEAMDSIAGDKLAMVGLEGFEHYMPSEISGGMRKRAAIARAMALDPKILFLDEPSAGLDPITSLQLDRLIADLSQILGITFVIVSHELASIDAIAERVVMLHQGKILAEGDPKVLKEDRNPLIHDFFNRSLEERTEV